MKKKSNQPRCYQFEFDPFIFRVSNQRIDIETRASLFKTVLFPNSTGYKFLARLLVPQAFPNEPECVSIANDPKAIKSCQEDAVEIARILFMVTETITSDTASAKDFYGAIMNSIQRRSPEAEKINKKSKVSAEENTILAEEKALHDPTEENVIAAKEAKDNMEAPKKKRVTKKKEQ